ncbi:hypothetical protein PPERSA_00859 [Pseudocohnilembus persalinus]|uniref:Transmembrane protein n=1 Tax=Pseudocohnilembus persalinus TaxID=266149 RepID=A0A0V0QEQ9_PSEPJ|nr:hypothetical protein PPERSA_00859 [Pseudocohnilembus persalinus]|eukprot:KRX00632.1 hypothetical protein PPERSA_00859 [Pseudocohnilembus persalinus]
MVKKPIYINIVNSFASGMYFSLSLNVFLPDGQILIQRHLENYINTNQSDRNFLINFPWSMSLATMGFLIYFTLEKLILNRYTTKELNQMLTNLEYQENVVNQKFNAQKQFDSGNQGSESFISGYQTGLTHNQSVIGHTYFGNQNKQKKLVQHQGSFNVQSDSYRKKNNLLEKTDSFVSLDTDLLYSQNNNDYDGMQSKEFNRSQLIFGKESQNLGNSSKNHRIFIVIYSAITPLAIVIGWIIESFKEDISGYIISFIGGNFIYISASYLLIEEFAFNTHYKWRKYMLFTISLILVIVLQICVRGLDEENQ